MSVNEGFGSAALGTIQAAGTGRSENQASGSAVMGPVTASATARIERNLVMTPEADDFLADLARRTGFNEGEVIRLALAMFKAAVDAKEQGKHIGVAGTSDALEVELVGF